ncbi:hypothetical protein ACPWSR_18335 [Alloiococcus sp. CFN-8]|uniref:hypothetical protein n=1 Tax=Alloiococcus sp. CFN-8 TaxID=3416081 RepID=UPI003CF4CCE4
MRKNNILIGIILIFVGTLYLLNIIANIDILSFSFLWPILLFFIGLSLDIKFFRERSNGGSLIPGGILIVLGVFFFIQHITDYSFSEYSWAFYSLSLAVGFLQYYFLYRKDRTLLIIGLFFLITFVVRFISIYFRDMLPWLSMELVLPIILIIVGILVIIKK